MRQKRRIMVERERVVRTNMYAYVGARHGAV